MTAGPGRIRVGLLGPLEVSACGGAQAELPGRHLRTLLAVLACHGNRAVPTGVLQEALWGDTPPQGAATSLRVYVHHLRRVVGHPRVRLRDDGYSLQVESGEVDVEDFRSLVARGRDVLGAGDLPAGVAVLREALALWRGTALEGLTAVPLLHEVGAACEELRLAALEQCVEAELALGRAGELVAELQALVGQHPFREGLRGQLMVALYRAGRQADALAEYRRAGRVLRDELGIDPGTALRRLHEQILSGHLPVPAPTPGTQVAGAVIPSPVRCLPRTVADFTGRDATVRTVLAVLTAAGANAPVVVVDGMAGSGKTTLALHVASLVGDRYPDAHLYVDLHGHSDEQPLAPGAALLILLRQLGIPAEEIPADQVERVGLWRSEVVRRRILVVLDNAASSAQLADLLPPSGLALVTTRRRLTGLDGVHLESLPLLDDDEVVALLARIVGDRVHTEADAAREMARRCGGLPLAVRLAGSRLAHRPRWRVADLVRRLDDSVLPQLAAEDRTVADTFAVSYRQLPDVSRRAFRLLGLYPGATFDALAVAALTGLALGQTRDLLDDLVDVHLVEEPDTGVFRLHDLIREYAATLAGELPAADRHAALVAVLDQQLHAAAATTRAGRRPTLDRDLRSPVPARPDLLAALGDPQARLERERPNLMALVEAAVTAEPGYAWMIPRAAWGFLWRRGYVDDIVNLHGPAVATAERLGDRSALATALHYLASASYVRAEWEEASALTQRAIQLRAELGEMEGVALSTMGLANVYRVTGRWAESIEIARGAQRWLASSPAASLAATLGHASVRLGRYTDALRYQRRALMIAIEARDLTRVGDTMLMLAVTKQLAGIADVTRTRRQLNAALRLARDQRDPIGEAGAVQELANLLRRERRYAEALVGHRRALDAATRLRVRWWESQFRTEFAATLLLAGETAEARTMAEEAVRVGQRYRMPYLVARAQACLADCTADVDPAGSRRLLERARDTFAQLDAAELDAIEQRLAG